VKRLLGTLFLVFLAALALAPTCTAASPLERGASYLIARRQADGGFAEPNGSSSAGLTAWVVLGLKASGIASSTLLVAGDYLAQTPAPQATDLELRLLAQAALGSDVSELADKIEQLRLPSGRIGPALNSTYWGALALHAADRTNPKSTLRYILSAQRKDGGWSWSPSAASDAGDTAAAIQALRASGTSARSAPIKRAVRYLRRCQNKDGGFAVSPAADSDSQSTAWAIQALLAARENPGTTPFRYLKRLQRSDGSFRYSTRYGTTPAWVTGQVLCALARKPFSF
jgi:hypothetical protein